MAHSALHNPHLPGDPFLWQGNETGVLLLHGLTATPVEVRGLAERLHRRGFTVAGPLLPGHGTTPEDLNRTPWQVWVRAAENSYRQLAGQCKRVFVGGESTGAVIALHLAARFPEIAGVLAYAPAIKLNLRGPDVLKMYLFAPFVPHIPKPNVNASKTWQGYPVTPLKAAVGLLQLGQATRRLLRHVSQPVLVVLGKLDDTVDPAVGRIILGKINSTFSQLVVMEHSTHVVLLDDELDRVADLTLQFMAAASGRSITP